MFTPPANGGLITGWQGFASNSPIRRIESRRPILYEIARRFHLKFNVRRADIDAGIGWVQLMLEGERSEIEAAIEWVEAQGIRADPVEGDIVSG